MKEEIWKDVEGYSKYEVSSEGSIRDKTTLEVRPQVWNGNFLCTNMVRDDGVSTLCKVHRVVAIAFIENIENAHNVVHKDGDRSNNSVGNLYWKSKKAKPAKFVPTIDFNGKAYSYEEFASHSGSSVELIKHRLKLGWSIRECFIGFKEFSGEGYEHGGMWFPFKSDMERYLKAQKILLREAKELEREQKKQERLNHKKYGVGVFENYPIEGIINRVATKTYVVWSGMLSRCYNKSNSSFHRYGGRGVKVCEEWHNFQNFAKWYTEQYAESDWHIDKDIICEGNLLYSPDTCAMVPPAINTFFSTLPKIDPVVRSNGVKYLVSYSIDNKKVQNNFDTKEEALTDYWDNKLRYIKAIGDIYYGKIDVRVYFAIQDLKRPIT